MTKVSTKPSHFRAPLHYIAAIFCFSAYGSVVCPFIDSLPPAVLLLQSATAFTFLYLARSILRSAKHGELSLRSNVTLFAIGGCAFAAWYGLFYDAPLESNLKVLLGITLLGTLISIDLSITSTRVALKRQPLFDVLPSQSRPLASQIRQIVMFVIIMITTVLGLIVVKDLNLLVNESTQMSIRIDALRVIREFAYIAIVSIIYIVVISNNGSALLNTQLQRQTDAMQAASSGDFDQRVPVNQTGELSIVAHYTNKMLSDLKASYREINITRDATIVGLSTLAEVRDNETGAHILRTQHYVKALAEVLKDSPKHGHLLTEENIELLYKSAPLHDIGKVGIPDSILLKPDKLTVAEFTIMKTHAQLGADALSITENSAEGIGFLTFAKEIAATHHEKWDGSGYPKGLAGADIPLSGRLMALADVYDALISKRVYKPAFSHEKARAIIIEGKGRHFDPEVVDAFLKIERKFVNIAERYSDQDVEAA